MTSQTGKNHHWRRTVTGAVASSAMAVGLVVGVGSPAALAQPEPTPVTDAPPNEQAEAAAPAPTGDVLAVIAQEYMTGAGGGQVSNFVKEALQLRALGFRPSRGNLTALQEALDKRPNQTPLVEALKSTVAYQRTLQARAAAAGAPPGGFTAGINQLPPGQQADPTDPDNTGVFIGPTGGINQPIG
jgi:hypothetical protein